MESDLSGYAEAIATALLGPPNRALSSPTDLRFGARGSLSVDLEKNGWFDHERNIGGGMVELVQDKLGVSRGEALRWIKDRGFATDRARGQKPSVSDRGDIRISGRDRTPALRGRPDVSKELSSAAARRPWRMGLVDEGHAKGALSAT